MFTSLLPNLKMIGILLIAYLGSLGVNTILGIYYNLDVVKQAFSWKKFWTGLARGGIIFVAAAAITVIISCLPGVLESFGITGANEIFEGISIAAIATVIISCIGKYLTDALNKFYKILREEKTETSED